MNHNRTTNVSIKPDILTNYRQAEGVIEGDTPSFLYILSGTRGLSDVNQPAWGGWGGRFLPMKTSPFHWIESEEGGTAIARWHDARQRDFAARMDWCVQPAAGANHAPLATLNGDRGVGVLFRDAMPGEKVALDASGSGDSDGQALTYAWWMYREAGTYAGELEIHGAASRVAHLSVPRDAGKTRIHVILQVTDSGSPPLTSYRRLIVNVRMSP